MSQNSSRGGRCGSRRSGFGFGLGSIGALPSNVTRATAPKVSEHWKMAWATDNLPAHHSAWFGMTYPICTPRGE